ncbi:hypothetical protein D0T49_05935 [Paludibacter sp. 221]|uniref:dual OB domain-containing protein n=1 Tax=Paludibacter sp. 221 TaxID=2302939 RepID=UPI0013D6C88D|nr:hypothetical protein [Paludibacter sp. 221]NDV46582.1 hypothetical protein [Paludibacter sp. 221]
MKKETILIISKTVINPGQLCVGALTSSGRQVRILDRLGNNQPQYTNLNLGQIWDIEYTDKEDNTPPHVEDILVYKRLQRGNRKEDITMKSLVEKFNIPIWQGHPDNLFDGLLQWTPSGSGYIEKGKGVPKHSVGFWISDRDLKKREYEGDRYLYPMKKEWRNFKLKGLQTPVDVIPAGTLIRVSLSRWKTFSHDKTPKCWLQLSGWYELPENVTPGTEERKGRTPDLPLLI